MNSKIKRIILPTLEPLPSRLYALDWLRVIAFGLLILFHIGMLYNVNWGFHIKSQYSSQLLENVMLLVEPWRMALIWFISGVAIRFVFAKVSLKRFLTQRSIKLLLPLLVGLFVIVPPQLYYQMQFNGELAMSYFDFYSAFLELNHVIFEKYSAGVWHHIDVNHLWYIRALWLYSLLVVLLYPIINAHPVQKAVNTLLAQPPFILFFLLLTPLFIAESLEVGRETRGLIFLLYGYLLGWKTNLWTLLSKHYKPLLLTAFTSYFVLIFFYNKVWLVAGGKPEGIDKTLFNLLYSFDYLIWLSAIIGLAGRFLNINHAKLTYLNEAVYPSYILHQTIIIVVCYELTQFHLGPVLEPIMVIAATFIGCFISYEVIRRVALLRPLFGLNSNTAPINTQKQQRLTTAKTIFTLVLILPLAWEIMI